MGFEIKVPGSKCEIEELEFAFNQVKDLLSSINDTFNSNYKKCYILLSILSGISIGLLTYSLRQINDNILGNPILYSSLILFLISFTLSIYLTINIRNRQWKEKGSVPSELINLAFYKRKESNPSYNVLKGMMYSELQSYEKRCRYNMKRNERLSSCINTSVIGLVSLPLIGAFCYAVSYVINHP